MYRTKWAQKKDIMLEKKVLENTDAILTTITKNLHTLLQKKTNKKLSIYTLYNGYDKNLMLKQKKKKSKNFRIVYTGILTDHQPYDSFIKALEIIKKKFYSLSFELIIAGEVNKKIRRKIKEKLGGFAIKFYGYVSHEKAVTLMKNAEVLINFLFSTKKASLMISGKLLEYMASENPILSIGDEKSEAARIIEKGNNAQMIHPKNIEKIVIFLEKIILQWEKNHFVQNITPNLNDYSREKITEKLIGILEKENFKT